MIIHRPLKRSRLSAIGERGVDHGQIIDGDACAPKGQREACRFALPAKPRHINARRH